MRIVSRPLTVVLIALAAVVPLGAQQTGTTGLLAGRVTVDDANGGPVRRAIVTLTGTGVMASMQLATDDEGRFAFPDLPAGRYTVTAEKNGFVKTYYGSARPGRGPSAPIALAAGERQSAIAIALVRGAVITGTVVDENGVPLSGSVVRVMQPLMINGERKLVDPPGLLQPWQNSDEQGRYRIYGLAPGEYTVQAGGGGALVGEVRQTTAADLEAASRELQGLAVPPTVTTAAAPLPASPPIIQRSGAFYPGVADAARAEIFTLRAGEERGGVNIRNGLVRATRVEGISVGPTGEPMQNVLVGIANASAGQLWGSPGLVRPGPDGHFVLPALTPGRYVLFGRGSTTQGANIPMTLWTQTEITVNEQDVTNVTMQFMPGVSVSGRIVYRGVTPPVVSGLRLTLNAVPTIAGSAVNPPPATVQADGSFSFSGIAPGKYRISSMDILGWALRSAIAGGQDILDVPLEISPGRDVTDLVVTFTNTPAEVTGQLVDRLNRPAPEFSVVLFTVDRAQWLTSPRRMMGPIRVASDGTFRFAGIAPGDYFLSALTDIDPRQLGDPALLDQLAAAAARVTVAEGERKVQNLRIGG